MYVSWDHPQPIRGGGIKEFYLMGPLPTDRGSGIKDFLKMADSDKFHH